MRRAKAGRYNDARKFADREALLPTTFSRSMRALESDRYRSSFWTLVVGASLLTAWGIWFAFSRIPIFEQSQSARVEVSHAAHRIEAPVAGRVIRTRMTLGKMVKKSELIVEIDSSELRLALDEKVAKRNALLVQIEGIKREIVAEKKALAVARKEGSLAAREARAQQNVAKPGLRYSRERAARLKRLRRGTIAGIDVLKAKQEAAEGVAKSAALVASARRLRQEYRRSSSDRQVRIRRLENQIGAITAEIAVIAASTKRLEFEIAQRKIKAPVSGALGDVRILRVGAYVRAGDLLGTVVPPGALRIVAQYHPSLAMGRVRVGQSARLRLDGFPWIEYGSVAAHVSGIGSEAQEGTVRVELEVDASKATRIPLQHGLPGVVEVEVEKVSPAVIVLRAAGKLIERQVPGEDVRQEVKAVE